MSSALRYVIPAVQIVAGVALSVFSYGAGIQLGYGLIASGVLGFASLAFLPNSPGAVDEDPNYTIRPRSNIRGEGEGVAVVYGEMETVPLAVSVDTQVVGNEQEIYVLLVLGEGEMADEPSDADEARAYWAKRITVNDQPILDVDENAEITYRNGTPTQTQIPNFAMNGTAYETNSGSQGEGDKWEYEMKNAADAVRALFVFPRGIRKVIRSRTRNSAGGAKIEYKEIDSDGNDVGGWVPYKLAEADQGNWVQTVPDDNIKNVVAGRYFISKNTTQVVRQTMMIRFPKNARYKVRFTGTVDDDSNDVREHNIPSIIELSDTDETYPNTALLGIKILASESVSGRMPVFRVLVKGKKVYDPVSGVSEWTRNPVWCLRDLLTNTRYGGGNYITGSMIDDGVGGSWRDAATRCDTELEPPTVLIKEAHYELDIAITRRSKAKEWSTRILQTFRTNMFYAQGAFRLQEVMNPSSFIEFTDDPADGTTKRPIIRDANGHSTLRVGELQASERYTHIKAFYKNCLTWKRGVVEATSVATPVLKQEIFWYGVCRETQAQRETDFLMNQITYGRFIIQFNVEIGDYHMVPGQGVRVYSDWADGDFATGKEFVVESIANTQAGIGLVTARSYDSAMQDVPNTNTKSSRTDTSRETHRKSTPTSRGFFNTLVFRPGYNPFGTSFLKKYSTRRAVRIKTEID